MFKENWINELQFHENTIPFYMTTLKFGNKEIVVPNISSLVIELMTYINGYGLVFGAYVEDNAFISKIAELPISAKELEIIKTNCTKLDNDDFDQIIQNKFNLDMITWSTENYFSIQFILKNQYQDNHFDCIQIMQDVFNQIAS